MFRSQHHSWFTLYSLLFLLEGTMHITHVTLSEMFFLAQLRMVKTAMELTGAVLTLQACFNAPALIPLITES